MASDHAIAIVVAALWIEAGRMHWFQFVRQTGVDAFVLRHAERQGDWLTWLWKAAFVLTWPALIWGGRLIAFATRPPVERLD